MALAQRGTSVSESNWNVFLSHAAATLAKFQVPEAEQSDVVVFVQSLKNEIVEQPRSGSVTVVPRLP
jgi:hemoglobin